MKKISMFLCFFIFFSCSFASDDYVITNYNSKNSNITSDVIISTAQTQDGYIWIGTVKGLYRFNGDKFEQVYKQYLESSSVNSICASGDKLIIGTYNGLLIFNTKKNTLEKHFLKNHIVFKLIKCTNDCIWILTYNNGIKKIFCNDNQIKLYEKSWLKDKKPISIYADNNDNIFVGTEKFGLYLFSQGDFIKFNNDIDKYSIVSILKDINGSIWVGTYSNGIFVLKGKRITHITEKEGLFSNNISVLGQNDYGQILIGTLKGFHYFDNGIKVDKSFDLLKDEYIQSIYLDNEKNIWVGTTEEGLFKLRRKTFHKKYYKSPMDLCCISAIIMDLEGNKYFSRYPGFLGKMEVNGDLEIIHDLNIIGGHIRFFIVDDDNNIYCGTYNQGLYIISNGNIEKIDVNKVFNKNITLTNLSKDKNNKVYFGTLKSGLFTVEGKEVKKYDLGKKLEGKRINNIKFDSKNKMYLATGDGLFYSNDSNNYTLLDSGFITSIYIDDSDFKWICSISNGLIKIDESNEEVQKFNIKNGMRTNKLYQIIEDNNSNFWITSDIGILKVNKESIKNTKKENKIVKVEYFGFDDGLDSLDFINSLSGNSVVKFKNGELLFCTRDGVYFTNPLDNSVMKSSAISLFLEKILVNGDQIEILDNFQIKNNDNVSFLFDSATFVSNDKLQYFCDLELKGHHREVILNSKGRLKFKSLKKGNYTLTVNILNRNGKLGKRPLSIKFKVKGTFFDLKLCLILFLLLVIIILLIIIIKKPKLFFHDLKNKDFGKELNIENLSEILKEVKYLVEVEKIYKEENLNLELFSQRLNLPTYITSQILNRKFNMSFSEYMNKYRIKEIKDRLMSEEDKNTKVIDIAFDAGFNSKAMFNLEFKKATGKTPSQFKKDYYKNINK